MTKFPYLRQDFTASLVVFLVALPLCVGVASPPVSRPNSA